jgi:hypothetical protein
MLGEETTRPHGVGYENFSYKLTRLGLTDASEPIADGL